jgi:hypothetical protein
MPHYYKGSGLKLHEFAAQDLRSGFRKSFAPKALKRPRGVSPKSYGGQDKLSRAPMTVRYLSLSVVYYC